MKPHVILRHKKENLKKCSLRGLESDKRFQFYTYPKAALPPLDGYILLTIDAPILSPEDSKHPLFLIDGTWQYAALMEKQVPKEGLIKRSLPAHFKTAYPRKQTGCPSPERGLASIEALYIAFYLTNRNTDGLLNNYYWKEQFLALNSQNIQ